MYKYDGLPPSSCPDCAKKTDADYQAVREYVRQNRGVRLEEVARHFNIPHSQVMQYLKEDRLEIHTQSQWFLKCELCGVNIMSGTRCHSCGRR